MDVRNVDQVPAFTTKDGSEIRELLAHRNSCIRNQTLAEARLRPGATTAAHHHARSEEIYYVLEGHGLMRVGDELRPVRPGDAIAIPPGAIHQITNTGSRLLKFLCCCVPGYEHDDTMLAEEGQ
ncbi:MAG TPA: cupin domain-containing protein [Planctomycetaceae bacterium]|nr:cupin domain-containing protein [Planctomycetaceae bacterium]HIQ22134.1 cupin domain-containing protein [Planctomycetota bacterium]